MHNFILTIQALGLICSLLGIRILIKQKHSPITIYVILANMAAIIYNIGYLLVITSPNIEAATVALKIEYLGTAFLYISFVKFIYKYFEVNYPKYFFKVWIAFEIFIQILVWTSKHHTLYYRSISFEIGDFYNYFNFEYGVFYIIRSITIVGAILLGLHVTAIKMKTTHSDRKRHNYHELFSIQLLSLVAFALMVSGVLKKYDPIPICSALTMGLIALRSGKRKMLSLVDLGKENVVDNMNEAFIIVEGNMEFVYANEMAIKLFGDLTTISEGDPLPSDLMWLFKEYEEDNEVRIRNRYYSINTTNLYQEKMIVGYSLTIVEITKRHELMMELSKAKENADSANKAKSEFLASMSHEIRTPINAILGMDELILREYQNDNVLEYATNIKNAGNSLLNLVNDILDISKIESGKMEVIPVEYDLSSMLNDLVMMVSLRVDSKGLLLNLDFSNDIPYLLYGDDVKIKQIITNLLTNAVKYTQEGSITFHLDWQKDNDNSDEINLFISVEDTGIGIEKDNINKLFDSFKRFDEKRNRNIEGTGLGLGIAANYLELMGSKLKVVSEYGKGSTFSFAIKQKVVSFKPIGDFHAMYQNSLKTKQKYKENFTAPDASILVVDDNEMNLKVVIGLLKLQKIKITTATSGRECLKLIEDNKYDIIFLDHMMPEMDGIETLSEIKKKKNNKCKDTPIIVLTANAITGAHESYIKAGFKDYLSKPIDFRLLEKMIIKYLPSELVHYEDTEVYIDANSNNIDIDLQEYNINIQNALRLIGGSEELFMEIAKSYVDNYENIRKDMINYLDCGNMKEYAILVHALKGDSRALGTDILGDIAYKHEMASKENNCDFIRDNWSELTLNWDIVIEGLKLYLSRDKNIEEEKEVIELVPIDDIELYEKLREAYKSLDDFMEDKALEILKDLLKYILNDKYVTEIKASIKEINDYDSEGAQNRIQKLIDEGKDVKLC